MTTTNHKGDDMTTKVYFTRREAHWIEVALCEIYGGTRAGVLQCKDRRNAFKLTKEDADDIVRTIAENAPYYVDEARGNFDAVGRSIQSAVDKVTNALNRRRVPIRW